MRRTLALILALGLMASPVAASENDTDTIDAVIEAAIDARGTDAYDAALAEVYAVYDDPVTPESCRHYVDAAHAALWVLDLAERYPESVAFPSLFEALMAAVPAYRNDCLLAV